jgi:hypothetical protein
MRVRRRLPGEIALDERRSAVEWREVDLVERRADSDQATH